MVLLVSIGCLGAAPPAASTHSVHTEFSSTYFHSREVRIDRRDVGDVVLSAATDGTATLTFAHTESGSTSRSKYVSRSGDHEVDRRASDSAWIASGRWVDGPDGRTFTFQQRAWAASPASTFPMEPALRLVCRSQPAFGPTSTVCSLSPTELLDGVAIDRITRQPWLHRGDPRRGNAPPEGEKGLWLGAPSLRLSASRRDAGKAVIEVH